MNIPFNWEVARYAFLYLSAVVLIVVVISGGANIMEDYLNNIRWKYGGWRYKLLRSAPLIWVLSWLVLFAAGLAGVLAGHMP